MTTVVIGGGVAGLAAARVLAAERGSDVVLLEAGDRWGGQVRTFEVGGGRVEIFYHHLFRSDVEVARVIHELGLGEDLEWIDSNVGLHAEGRNYPFVGPLDLLRFDRVSLLTRIRLGLTALWLRRVRSYWRYEGTRASEWLPARVGREGYERVWGPLLRAKFGEHAERVSMVWFWGKIHLRFASREGGMFAKEQLGYLRGSFGRLIDAYVARLEQDGVDARLDTGVARIVHQDGHVRGVELADGSVIEAEQVIATVPSTVFSRMLPEIAAIDPRFAELLSGVVYQWAMVLVLTLDRPLSSLYWLTMTDADAPFVVAVEQTNFVSPERYGGQHIVYFSRYCDPDDPIIELDVDEVVERFEPWIRRINPEFDRAWVQGQWLFTDRAGQPVVHERYHEQIPPHRTPIAGLYLANTTQIYPEDRGQNYSIRMGERVARLMITDREGEEPPDEGDEPLP